VYYDVEVPNFSKPGLWLSGVVFSSTPGLPAAPRDVLSALLPVVPTTVREFERDDDATAFLRLYQRAKEARAVQIGVRILDSQGAAVDRVDADVSAESFARSGSADYQYRLPLARLAAGSHLVTIEARAGAHTARREVRFARRQ
jgi:hypothetical protein